MEDFFQKIKKKLSVDNLIDLMREGKLKDELKQTLTAKANLNESTTKQEGKSSDDTNNMDPRKQVTVENLQSKRTEEQTNIDTVTDETMGKNVDLKITSSKVKLKEENVQMIQGNVTLDKQSVESIISKQSVPVNVVKENTTVLSTIKQSAMDAIKGKASVPLANVLEDSEQAARQAEKTNELDKTDSNIMKKQAEARRRFEEFLIWT